VRAGTGGAGAFRWTSVRPRCNGFRKSQDFGEVAKWLGSGLQNRHTPVRIRSSPPELRVAAPEGAESRRSERHLSASRRCLDGGAAADSSAVFSSTNRQRQGASAMACGLGDDSRPSASDSRCANGSLLRITNQLGSSCCTVILEQRRDRSLARALAAWQRWRRGSHSGLPGAGMSRSAGACPSVPFFPALSCTPRRHLDSPPTLR
jgi:hypothetical protein